MGDWIAKTASDALYQAAVFFFQTIPTWVWIGVGGVLIGVVFVIAWQLYKFLGWRGVVAAVVGAGGIFGVISSFRSGFRYGASGRTPPPLVQIEDYEEAISPAPTRRKRRTILDLIRGGRS